MLKCSFGYLKMSSLFWVIRLNLRTLVGRGGISTVESCCSRGGLFFNHGNLLAPSEVLIAARFVWRIRLRVAARALCGGLFFNHGDLLAPSEVLIAARVLRGGLFFNHGDLLASSVNLLRVAAHALFGGLVINHGIFWLPQSTC